MSSKDEILAAIKKNTLQKFDYPAWKVNAIQYPDLVSQFISISAAVGGEAVELPEGKDLNEFILERYPNMNAIASNMPEITCSTLNPDDVEVAQDLNGTDLAVVKGEIGVAENGCVWIPQTVKHKIIYFIAERLVIILEKKNLVNNMAEAYAKIQQMPKYNFATFISGPSKTADIEQTLVKGAHGAMEALVILV
ncbi:MAG: LUD domain-containing protein [Bacteroidaceae bacterium]|nr:LUD domain-containing protein [Bacteroidaceae bacterium]MBQ8008240.1 LUD domain-containing protein [Bacteroidaceae bacterium]MBR1541188.1 LUD domain-containing protein [Bacteroidaceae bacterium]